jgi:hypothetical protein
MLIDTVSPTSDDAALERAREDLARALELLDSTHPTTCPPFDPAIASELTVALGLVQQEVARACLLHPEAFQSPHEALAIIEEEFLEFRAEVFKKRCDGEAMRIEAMQLAAMCVRFLVDLT